MKEEQREVSAWLLLRDVKGLVRRGFHRSSDGCGFVGSFRSSFICNRLWRNFRCVFWHSFIRSVFWSSFICNMFCHSFIRRVFWSSFICNMFCHNIIHSVFWHSFIHNLFRSLLLCRFDSNICYHTLFSLPSVSYTLFLLQTLQCSKDHAGLLIGSEQL